MVWSSTPKATALTAVAPLIWGTTYLVTTEWLPPDRPLWSGTLRALPAGVIAVTVARQRLTGTWWWKLAALGVLNIGGFFALLFVAAYRLPGGVAATLFAISPLVVAGLAVLLLRERPGHWRLGWGVAGVIGVGLMVLRPGAHFDLVGILAGLAGMVSMSTGIVLTRRWGNPIGALSFAGWQLTAGGLFLLPLALVIEGTPPQLSLPAIGGYAWLGLAGALLAYPLWFRGVGVLPVTAVSFLTLLSPVVATVLGWSVLGQDLTITQTAGFLLALAAVIAAQIQPRLPRGHHTRALNPGTNLSERTHP